MDRWMISTDHSTWTWPLFSRTFKGFTQTHSPYYGFYEKYLYLQLQMVFSDLNKLKGSYQHYEADISKRRHCKRH